MRKLLRAVARVFGSQLGLISPMGDVIASIVVVAIALPATAFYGVQLWDTHAAKAATFDKSMEAREIYAAHQDWASRAYAYVIPPRDVNGADNADHHDYAAVFTTVDAGGAVKRHYHAWHFDAAAKTLRLYAYDAPSPSSGQAATNATALSSSFAVCSARGDYQLASAIDTPQLHGFVPHDAVVNLGQPDENAGNRGVIVHYDTCTLAIEQHLRTRLDVSGYTVNVGTFSRGPLLEDPVRLVFIAAGDPNPTAYHADGTSFSDPNGALTMSELHYYPATGVPPPAGYFNVDTSACGAGVSSSIGTVAADDSRPVTVALSAQQPSQHCTVQVGDDHGGVQSVDVTVLGPLTATPTTMKFVSAGAAAQTVAAHEDYYTGAISVTASTCATIATIAGSGNGPDVSFTVTPVTAGQCSFSVVDDHGGVQTVNIAIYGVLTVSPNSLTFPAHDAPAQNVTAHEDGYRGQVTAEGVTPGPGGEAGCDTYASESPAGVGLDGAYNGAFAVTPQRVTLQCAVTMHDDHGGVAQALVVITDPNNQVLVCNTDPRAGTTDNSTNPPTNFIGTTASPPCAPVHLVCSTNPLIGTTAADDGGLYVADGNSCAPYSFLRSGGNNTILCADTSAGVFPVPLVRIHVPGSVLTITLMNAGVSTGHSATQTWTSNIESPPCGEYLDPANALDSLYPYET